ncbi:hypothetical protein SRABI130_02890 [Pseudomonas sp. Bi130]|jgi:hypothetical protein|uniref:hypothetical protein n=1 Tax=Pseudomonas sp. Bi130 TaxID=2821122 RepID=UPI001D3F6A86|nr:hypothetical protein [Pseudomonas sp. Bi130]CAH0236901.1 hypothetical protein SRABI130_02890 [Pseudomonas sp. Bi130]
MNNVEKAEYLREGIRDVKTAIATEDPLTVPKKLSLRTRIKKVLDGTRGSEVYEDLVDKLIPIKPGFNGDDLSAIVDAIEVSRLPSLVDVFKVELLEKDLGL